MIIKIAILIILFILGGFWRRLFGGWCNNIIIIKNRFFQHILGFLLSFIVFYNANIFAWYACLLFSVLIQALFWAPAHGACFDMGRTNDKDNPKMIERYKKTIGNRIVNWLLPNRYNYGFIYDFTTMFLRYTIPTLIFIGPMPKFVFVGLSIAPIYSFCWTFFEKEKDNIRLPNFISHATALAEFISGGLVYSSLFYFLYF